MSVTEIDSHYDTIIIGCGMAGLAAGIRLAMFDRKVLILEKHNAPGGLNSFYFKDGRRFDVGLHAVTNFVPVGVKGTPLVKLLRQLRIPREAFALCPQKGSRISFDGVDLRFGNGIALLESEVANVFPGQIDRFRQLRKAVLEYNEFDPLLTPESTRERLESYLGDPLLRDMLLCPLMYYGNAREHDMDFDQFVILWKAIFEEGFGRPYEGVRVIIRALLQRYRDLGGQRRMKCGVRRLHGGQNKIRSVELENGEVLTADHVISTAGHAETLRLCEGSANGDATREPATGPLSFIEALSVLDCQPRELGVEDTIIFFNHGKSFRYQRPVEDVDLSSGVICFPNNYQYGERGELEEGMMRVTMMAHYDRWKNLAAADYALAKAHWFPEAQQSAAKFLPSVSAEKLQKHTVARDMFTPRTIEYFTGHIGGAVYGAPEKSRSGKTSWSNLYLAGTDQGFLGITGAMLSGISMANAHVLSS